MGLFTFLETINLNFNCFRPDAKNASDDMDKKLYHVSKEHKISILPIMPTFDLENLYPITDGVGVWNIFVVGNDKTYVLSQVNDPSVYVPEAPDLLNRKAMGILPADLTEFFDTVWDRTLTGVQLQFYMTWNGRLYFINTYPFFNGKKVVIGAIMFMRAFDSLPESHKRERAPLEQRASKEIMRGVPGRESELFGK